jgi:hypothetical protein
MYIFKITNKNLVKSIFNYWIMIGLKLNQSEFSFHKYFFKNKVHFIHQRKM